MIGKVSILSFSQHTQPRNKTTADSVSFRGREWRWGEFTHGIFLKQGVARLLGNSRIIMFLLLIREAFYREDDVTLGREKYGL